MESKLLKFWTCALIVFFFDRISKVLVRSAIPLGESMGFGPIAFTHLANTGTVFGLFKGVPWLFTVLSIGVSIYLVKNLAKFETRMLPAFGFILGGALGNVVDRLFYGAVIDFIDVHFWPVFNVADAAISLALVYLCIDSLRTKKTQRKL